MNILKSILCTLCLAAGVGGQTTQPIFPPATRPYAVDRAFYVSTSGNDANPGTVDKPFATPNAANTAITKARWTRQPAPGTCDAILLRFGDTHNIWSVSIDSDSVIVGAYNQGTWTDRASVVAGATAFNSAGHNHVHFVGLDIQAANHSVPPGPNWQDRDAGSGINFIRSNQNAPGDDCTVDNCAVRFFTNGVSFLGNNGTHLRVWNSFVCYNYCRSPVPAPVNKSQGIYAEGDVADLRFNVIAFNGIGPKDDLSNWMTAQSYIQNHGVYLSAFANPAPSLSTGNLYICNAATGIQMRPGGVITGDVFITNGVASDAFTDGVCGVIAGNGILGNREPGVWNNAGGSLLGQSDRQIITGNIFLRANPTPDQPLRLGWNNPTNDITGSATPSADSYATIAGNYGVFPAGGVAVTKPRAYQTIGPNNIATGPTKDILDYSGQPTVAAYVEFLRTHPDQVNAAAVLTWMQGQLPVAAVPAPEPAPFDVVMTVDPKTQTVKQKH